MSARNRRLSLIALLPLVGLVPRARAQAVAFQPVVGTFPNGIISSATPVVSADRRYVRMTVSPQFTDLLGFDVFSVPAAVSGASGGGPGGGLGGLGGAAGAVGARAARGVGGAPGAGQPPPGVAFDPGAAIVRGRRARTAANRPQPVEIGALRPATSKRRLTIRP